MVRLRFLVTQFLALRFVNILRFDRVLYSYLKPESARVHPEATVRPWSTLEIDGDAMAFASALGYMWVVVGPELMSSSTRPSL